ncbi:MAG: lantibiotic dehydratase family protein [Acetobacteraceae bacterium]|nr:lantibiotic dehydratase family protein [Acetobacteraceae bacterium]
MVALWRFAKWFVLRHAGFPADHLTSLTFSESCWLAERSPESEAAGREALNRESEAAAVAVARLFTTPRFAGALLLSNPGSYEVLSSWAAQVASGERRVTRSLDRQKSRTLMMYLQRLCMKSETCSFFGSTAWGRLDPESRQNVSLTGPPQAAAAKRRVVFAHWAAQALASAISDDPALRCHIPFRTSPSCIVQDGRARMGGFTVNPILRLAEIDLSPLEQKVLERLREPASLAELAVGLGVTAGELNAVCQRLAKWGLLADRLEIPVGTAEGLAWLQKRCAVLPGWAASPWREVLASLSRMQKSFEDGDVTERAEIFRRAGELFLQATGLAPIRRAGQHHADRALFAEDCGDAFSLVIGGELAQDLTEGLAAVLNRVLEPSARRQLSQRLELARRLRAQFGPQARLPLDAFLAWSRHELRHGDCPEQPSHAALGGPLVCGPDVIIDASSVDDINEGRYQLILGETHGIATLLLQERWAAFHPDPQSLTSEVQGLVTSLYPECRVVQLASLHDNHGDAAFYMDIPAIEAPGPAPLDLDRIPAGALTVGLYGHELVLYAPASDEPLKLSEAASSAASLRSLIALLAPMPGSTAEPIPDLSQRHTGRITEGRFVVRRERWILRRTDLQPPGPRRSDWQAFVAARRAVRALGLPRFTFVRLKGEPKPVFVDWENWLLIDSVLRHCKEDDEPLVVTEALPQPGEAWLPGVEGRVVSEVRMGGYHLPGA